MLTNLFDGVASGMVLFILASGLAVTLGLMNFVNLAHGAFAMAGGYAIVQLTVRWGIPFMAALPLAFIISAALGAALERTLYVHLYGRPHLEQVLFSIGLVFMAVAIADFVMGSGQQFAEVPDYLKGRFDFYGVGIGRYRLFIVAVCAGIMLVLQTILARSRFGAQLRAAVDDARTARGLGIPVDRIFTLTFAVGSGLAGLGGALGAEILTLTPTFPLKYMISFLIVVTVGGTSSMTGPFLAALMLGIADVAGNYYVPSVGAFVTYALMLMVLMLRPQGLFARPR